MGRVLFDGNCVQVIERRDRLYVRYDGGQFAEKMLELEINNDEYEKIKTSKMAAYAVILLLQSKSDLL